MLSYKVSDGIYLTCQELSQKEPKKVAETPVNHIVVIDCSGSMYGELPRIREQLKKKLPKLIGEKDTLSIIWFSGRGEFGALLEAEPVATLTDLQGVNSAIDRWLKPCGLTGFKEPLEEVTKLIERVKGKNNNVFSLFFMSDGCDNQWDRAVILKTVESAAKGLSSATFVEYGYYADRPLLTQMAEKAGGQVIFAEHFDTFQPILESALSKKLSGAPRIEISVPTGSLGGFIYALDDGAITTYAVEDGKAMVPEDLKEVWWISLNAFAKPVDACEVTKDTKLRAISSLIAPLYAAASLFSIRMKPDTVFPLLKCLGDVDFIERFSTCFGKQKYSDFMDSAKAAAFDPSLRYLKGYDPSKVPDDNAYTIFDLLQLLSSDENNKVLLEHPEFKYSRISRGRVDSDDVLTEEERTKVVEITSKLSSEKNTKKVKALQEELASLTANKPEALKFEADPCPEGYPISSLTYNEDRPNISILVRKTGKVDLSKRLPAEFKGKVPEVFKTFIFRNYAIVKDGLINIDMLPVRVTRETAYKLAASLPEEAKPKNLKVHPGDMVEGVINLRALPVINRRMVRSASAKVLFQEQFELESARASQKVYKFYRDEKIPRKESASFKTTYGEEAAEWLKNQGFTDYSGFGPKTVQADATDFYLGKELLVSIKGLSSLPKVADVKAKMGSGKLTTGVSLMAPYVKEVESWLVSPEYTKAVDKDAAFIAWIDSKAKDAINRARQLIYEIACVKMTIIVGQVWFEEFASLDENTMTLDFGDLKGLTCKVEMKEVKVLI